LVFPLDTGAPILYNTQVAGEIIMPIFKLVSVSGKTIAAVSADNIETIFEDDGLMYLITIDGREHIFYRLEYVPAE
jgi:hypothetical protein